MLFLRVAENVGWQYFPRREFHPHRVGLFDLWWRFWPLQFFLNLRGERFVEHGCFLQRNGDIGLLNDLGF